MKISEKDTSDYTQTETLQHTNEVQNIHLKALQNV